MRVEKLFAAALAAVALAGCADGPVSVAGGDGHIILNPRIVFAIDAASEPIHVIRTTPTFVPDGGPAGPRYEHPVGADDDVFVIDAPIDLGDRDSATIAVLIEMLSSGGEDAIVEWSGMVGPVHVVAGEPVDEQDLPVTQLLRGPIENQLVESVTVSGPSFLIAGETHPAHAFVTGSGTSHTTLWFSSNEEVVTVDPVGDSVGVRGMGAGAAMIIASAGAHADTLFISVDTVTAGPPAFVFAFPDSAVLTPGSTRTWQAIVVDSAFVPVSATIDWESLDPSVATVNSSGTVSAQTLGRARIVASVGSLADTVIANVQNLPAGVTIMWQGGTPLSENDWFTPDNWTPARVPNATDVVYIPGGAEWLELNANAEIGGLIADSSGNYSFEIGTNTLTIHGDLRAPYVDFDSGGALVLDAASAVAWTWYAPPTTVLGDLTIMGQFTPYGLHVDGSAGSIHFEIPPTSYVFVYGDATLTDATLGMSTDSVTFEESIFYVEGDLTFDGGGSRTSITGGAIDVEGDFTVTAASCDAFAPVAGNVELFSDSATISVGCAGPNGNRFVDLWIFPEDFDGGSVELGSDLFVLDELYFDGGVDLTTVLANGHTIHASWGSLYDIVIDHGFIQVDNSNPEGVLYMDSVTFTGMTGETRAQVVVNHPGNPNCPTCVMQTYVLFDPTSAGDYVEVHDTEANTDSVIVYNFHNPGDGPERTLTSGGAVVHWGDVPFHLLYWSGSGQSGPGNQPVADSLVAYVVDFNFVGVEGTTVEFTVTQGNSSVSPTSAVTDEDGLARTELTLGDTTAATHEIIATTAALPQDTVYFYGNPTSVAGGSIARPLSGAASPDQPARMEAPARREPSERPIRVVPSRPARAISAGERR